MKNEVLNPALLLAKTKTKKEIAEYLVRYVCQSAEIHGFDEVYCQLEEIMGKNTFEKTGFSELFG